MKDYKTTWQVHGIFPEPIYLSHLDRPFTKKELNSVDSHKKGLIQNAGNKTSKNKYVLNKPEMSKLKKDLLKHINLYLEKVIDTEHKVSLHITQSWLNYTNENQYHHEHSHANSFLAGVIYMKANSKTDRIYFHKDMSKGALRLNSKTFNLYNSPEWFFRIAESMIVLFPSYLVHSVKTKNDDSERTSLAFNVYLKGKIGSYHSITELVL